MTKTQGRPPVTGQQVKRTLRAAGLRPTDFDQAALYEYMSRFYTDDVEDKEILRIAHNYFRIKNSEVK
jgi:hypothetical protein